MFTGIIETTGKVNKIKRTDSGMQLSFSRPKGWKDVKVGESINVNGVCSTVIKTGKELQVEYMPETLSRSAVAKLKISDTLNLERSLRLSDRLSGHLVYGHVDAAAKILKIQKKGNSFRVRLAMPQSLRPYLVNKGSTTLNGISLTVTDVKTNQFTVDLIPYTWKMTNFKNCLAGDAVNVEVDPVIRYVKSLLKA